jgi:hypothetical protein
VSVGAVIGQIPFALGALIAHHSVACVFQESEAAQDCVISLEYHPALDASALITPRHVISVVFRLVESLKARLVFLGGVIVCD